MNHDRIKSSILVSIQLVCILLILATGPLFAANRLLLVVEAVGIVLGIWSLVVMGKKNMNISPAVRDYLSLEPGKKVHWRFVEAAQVPYGPWKKYGYTQTDSSPPLNPGQRPPDNADLETQRRYLEYLRKLRDEEYLKKPLSEIQR